MPLHVESRVADVSTEELAVFLFSTLNDPRSWASSGFEFTLGQPGDFRVVLAEGPEVDRLCEPLKTGSNVSCQNGSVVALNAGKWRFGPTEWDSTLDDYRRYLVNHEVGHLIGQRHPSPRCPDLGAPNAVMEQQTGGLKGCSGNAWPLGWELERAAARPAVLAPLPDWQPEPTPVNLGGLATTTVPVSAAPDPAPTSTAPSVPTSATSAPSTTTTSPPEQFTETSPEETQDDGSSPWGWIVGLVLLIGLFGGGTAWAVAKRRQ